MSRLRFFSFLAIAFAVLFVSCSKEKEPVDPNDDRHIVGYESAFGSTLLLLQLAFS